MKEEYFKELEQKIKEFGLVNGDDILNKYQHYYDLAIEAGFSEEEAINKLGSVDDILSKYQSNLVVKEETSGSKINLHLSIIAGDINIVPIKEDKINVSASEKFYKYYDVINNESGLDIHLKKDRIFNKNISEDLYIEIGENFLFDEVLLSVTSADLDTKYVFNCNNIKINTVSGDINIGDIKANENALIEAVSGDIEIKNLKAQNVKIDEVSGDVTITNIDCNNIKMNSVSGDMDITGKSDNVKGNSISGDISFNNVKQNNLKDNLKNTFSKW